MEPQIVLPSEFKPGDADLKLVIPGKATIEGVNVTKVSFTESQVFYDIEVLFTFPIDGGEGILRMPAIRAGFIQR